MMTPDEYQSKLISLQSELQKQLAELQAKNDFAGIAALSAGFQKKVADLAAEFSASFSAGNFANSMTHLINSVMRETDGAAEAGIDKRDELPLNDDCARLMLFGAMYVEENERLRQLDKNISGDQYRNNEKQILTECFCALDMGAASVEPERVREVLKDSWDINDKESLVTTLAWLLKEGHHQRLMQLISFCKSNPSLESRTISRFREQFDEPLAYEESSEQTFRRGLVLAESKEAKLTAAGIRGWDIARYVHVLRFGYMARFIHADECWLHLQRLEPVVNEFTGWNDYAHSYIVGYRWWSGTAGPIEDACQRLLDHPKSPWKHFGWFENRA